MEPTSGENGYDFFAPAAPTGPATPGAPTASGPLGSTPPTGQFGGPAAFGTPTTPFTPVAAIGSTQPPPVRRSRRRRPRWVKPVALIALTATLVAAGLMLSPKVHLPERITYYRTTLTLPDTTTGLNRDVDPELDASAAAAPDQAAQEPPLGRTVTGVYESVDGERAMIVTAAKYASPNINRRVRNPARLNELIKTKGQGRGVGMFAEIAPGKLGGQVICAPATFGTQSGRLCQVNDIAVSMFIAFRDGKVSDATVIAVREAVEVLRG